MDAESVFRDMVEQLKLELQGMPPRSRDRHAVQTATPWLGGARHALVTMGLISQERADEILFRDWFDGIHHADLLRYPGARGARKSFSVGFSKRGRSRGSLLSSSDS